MIEINIPFFLIEINNFLVSILLTISTPLLLLLYYIIALIVIVIFLVYPFYILMKLIYESIKEIFNIM